MIAELLIVTVGIVVCIALLWPKKKKKKPDPGLAAINLSDFSSHREMPLQIDDTIKWRRIRPQSSHHHYSPNPALSSGSGFLEGMVAWVIADEVLSSGNEAHTDHHEAIFGTGGGGTFAGGGASSSWEDSSSSSSSSSDSGTDCSSSYSSSDSSSCYSGASSSSDF